MRGVADVTVAFECVLFGGGAAMKLLFKCTSGY